MVLLTNAPRSAAKVAGHLAHLGVTREHYDLIVTSGDVTHELMKPYDGHRIYYLGPERDLGVLDDLRIEMSSPDEAEVILCVGLVHDDTGDAWRLCRAPRADEPPPPPDDLRQSRQSGAARQPAHLLRRRPCRALRVHGGRSHHGRQAIPAHLRSGTWRSIRKKRGPTPRMPIFSPLAMGPRPTSRGPPTMVLDVVLITAGGISEEGADPAELEAEIRRLVPGARIIRTFPELSWS